MPPRDKFNNWLLWWVIIVSVSYVLLSDIFEATITLGEVVGLAIAVPASIFGIWKIVNHLIYCKYPFHIRYQEKLQYTELNTFGSMTIQTGTSKLILRMHPKRPQEFNEIHVRLLDEKKWFNSLYPPRDSVAVVGLQAEGMLGNNELTTKEDNTNGLHGLYKLSYHRAPEEALILTVTISANIPWNGFMVFRAKHMYGRPKCIYLPLMLEGKKVHDE